MSYPPLVRVPDFRDVYWGNKFRLWTSPTRDTDFRPCCLRFGLFSKSFTAFLLLSTLFKRVGHFFLCRLAWRSWPVTLVFWQMEMEEMWRILLKVQFYRPPWLMVSPSYRGRWLQRPNRNPYFQMGLTSRWYNSLRWRYYYDPSCRRYCNSNNRAIGLL